MVKNRITNSIEIVEYAIKNNISIKKACTCCGFTNTYVKNAKIDIFKKNIFNDDDTKLLKLIETYKSQQVLPEKQIQQPKEGVGSNIGNQIKDRSINKERIIEFTSNSSYPKGYIKTLQELLDRCKVDQDIWNVKDYTVNKWDVTSFKGNNAQTIENFQVKARLEKNIVGFDSKFILQGLKEMINQYEFPTQDLSLLQSNYTIDYTENNLLEIPLFDLHLGKLAWAGETGENYDTRIATARFINTIKKIVQRANGYNFSKILFPIGSDFFNSDNLNNTTTKGTPQDEDLRWQKTYLVGVKLIVDAINILKQTGRDIDVMVIPGNHDFERSFYLGVAIEAWFRDDNHVKIYNSASPRKYYKFGDVLLGFTHGDSEKESSLPMIMATEAKEDWGTTKFHEFHLGHIHRRRKKTYTFIDVEKTVDEELGMIIRYMPSLTGTEEWHHKKGYIGQLKGGEGYIWNDKAGLIGFVNSNIVE